MLGHGLTGCPAEGFTTLKSRLWPATFSSGGWTREESISQLIYIVGKYPVPHGYEIQFPFF